MSLKVLVYVSMSSRPMSDDDLKAILKTARENNEPRGITGMLLYQDGMFIQSLEGEEQQVNEIYAKICTDDRHRSIIKVFENYIIDRTFGNWTMGFNRLEDADQHTLPEFTQFFEQPEPLFLSNNPSRAKVLLEHFKDRTFF